jgi:hypothetical protein
MQMNYRFAHISAAAGGLMMMLGYLIVGGQPTNDEVFFIVVASFLTAGIVLGLLAEKRDRADRDRQGVRGPDRR